ncbi:MAG: DNA repair protein RecO [Cyanobacteria bacterium J06621_3]
MNAKQRTYRATGINLKGMPMGESDRLVTVLTKEHGLVRAIAPGARKHKSRLAGRSGLFVVNDGLFTRGKSIDKLIQAETLKSFPGLSRDLAKLTASQYLAEVALAQALTNQPQEELYYLLVEHLGRIEAADKPNVLACLAQATFHLLALAGVAPEVFRCCLSREPLTIELGNPDWQVGFSISSGGAVAPEEIARLERDRLAAIKRRLHERNRDLMTADRPLVAESAGTYPGSTKKDGSDSAGDETTIESSPQTPPLSPSLQKQFRGLQTKVPKDVARELGIVTYLSAAELALMQQLSKPELVLTAASARSTQHFTQQERSLLGSKSGTIKQVATQAGFSTGSGPHLMWRHIEKALRQYVQYQFDRPIRSAALIDTCL